MYSSKVFEAFEYASARHTYQRRKGNRRVPYINHPARVAATLARLCPLPDETLLLAAILHDVIEDTDATPEEVSSLFGEAVTALVLEVTDDMRLPYADRKRLQIEKAGSLSDNAKRIKIADKLCNMQDILAYPLWWSKSRKLFYFQWSGEVVSRCAGSCTPLEDAFWKVLRTGIERYS